jgi:hypothetical protein
MRLGLPGLQARRRPGTFAILAAKAKGATDFSVAPWLVPSPRYFAKLKLLQLRPCRTGADGNGCLRSGIPRRVEVDDAIFAGTEAAHTGLVEPSG